MGFLIFLLYMAVASAVAYGVITIIHNIRKQNSNFLIEGYCSKSDHQYCAAILLGIFWPLAAPIGFAILFAYKKSVEDRGNE